MKRIPEEVINDIRRKARIEQVIGHYLKVQKKGSGYVAVCPFHDDHDPSLSIAPDKAMFKCFVCETAGDVFTFVRKYENIDYPAAVRKVAELIGYDYDFSDTYVKPAFVETSLHKVMQEAVTYCQYVLDTQEGAAYKNYLLSRQIDEQMMEKYQLGCNPGNNALYNFLSRKGYSDRDIVQANLARATERGLMDVFYNRLMIPVHDQYGHPIAFTARSLDPKAESKYINTTDTPLFKKGDVIFNYHRAVEPARKSQVVILAEGPMDVMAFAKAGYENAVCALGTSFSRNQFKSLRKVTENVLLAYDGDKAGQNAIYRAGNLAREAGFKVTVLGNDTKMDPDEIVRKEGPEALKRMVGQARTWIQFLLEYLSRQYDLNNYSARKEYAEKMAEEINKLSDSFDRDYYYSRLAEISGFELSVLTGNLAKKEQKEPVRQTITIPRKQPKREFNGLKMAERAILYQIMNSCAMCDIYKAQLNSLPDENENQLAQGIVNYYRDHDTIEPAALIDTLNNEKLNAIIYDLDQDETVVKVVSEQILLDNIKKVQKHLLEMEKQLRKQMNRTYTDPVVQGKIGNEIQEINKKQREL